MNHQKTTQTGNFAPIQPPSGHVLVCGGGRIGAEAAMELLRLRHTHITVIERERTARDALRTLLGTSVSIISGDATEETVLESAGIDYATGVIAALGNARDNLFLALTVRRMNGNVRLVSRLDMTAKPIMFRQIGVDAVVNPPALGGRRLAHAMVNPELADLSDALLSSEERRHRLAPLEIKKGSTLAAKRLSECAIQQETGCIVIGLKRKRQREYVYQPAPSSRLRVGGSMLVLGAEDDINRLRALLDPRAAV